MAAQTGSTYIPESVINIVEIPTANSGFMTMTRYRKVLASDCDSNRQPEVAIWPQTGNVYKDSGLNRARVSNAVQT